MYPRVVVRLLTADLLCCESPFLIKKRRRRNQYPHDFPGHGRDKFLAPFELDPRATFAPPGARIGDLYLKFAAIRA